MEIIKVDMKQFKPKSRDDEELPYIKLAECISNAIDVPVSELHVSNYGVCLKDQELLKKYTKQWASKVYPDLRGTQKLDATVAMLYLQYSPVDLEFLGEGYILYDDVLVFHNLMEV